MAMSPAEKQRAYRDRKRGGPPVKRKLSRTAAAIYWRKKRNPEKYGEPTEEDYQKLLRYNARQQKRSRAEAGQG